MPNSNRGGIPVSDETERPQNTLWLLLSNQIQQLSMSLNDRFNDQKIYIDQRFEHVDQRFEHVDQRFELVDQRFEQVNQRFELVDQRFEQMDRRFTDVDQALAKLDGKLGFRVSIWAMILVAVLSVVLGVMASHTRW